LPEKYTDNFLITSVASGQLEALITPRMEATNNFSAYFEQCNGSNQRKLLFESELSSSAGWPGEERLSAYAVCKPLDWAEYRQMS
jgi:hypothetical protein